MGACKVFERSFLLLTLDYQRKTLAFPYIAAGLSEIEYTDEDDGRTMLQKGDPKLLLGGTRPFRTRVRDVARECYRRCLQVPNQTSCFRLVLNRQRLLLFGSGSQLCTLWARTGAPGSKCLRVMPFPTPVVCPDTLRRIVLDVGWSLDSFGMEEVELRGLSHCAGYSYPLEYSTGQVSTVLLGWIYSKTVFLVWRNTANNFFSPTV